MPSKLDLNTVRVYAAVVDEQSFAGAARQLQLPASNVSRHVAALERSLGVRLLERSTRHLRMTEAGRLLYQRAKPLLDTLAATAEELGAGEQALRGPLRMCMPGEAPLLLGPIIAEFCASHPGVELQCDTRMAGEQALREDMDLAIVFHRGDQDDSTLVTRELASLPSLVVGARADRPRRHAHAHGAAQDAALHHDLERAAGATLAFCGHRRTHGEGAGAQPLPRQQRRAGAGGRAPGYRLCDPGGRSLPGGSGGGPAGGGAAGIAAGALQLLAVYGHRHSASARVRTLLDLIKLRLDEMTPAQA